MSHQSSVNVCCRVKNIGGKLGCLYCNTDLSSQTWELWEWPSASTLLFRNDFVGVGRVDATIAEALPINKWVHIAVTYQRSSGNYYLYQNSVEMFRG